MTDMRFKLVKIGKTKIQVQWCRLSR